mmetsp:Transcript_18021/g.57171  ORF Transcript_18021/g.57171 Transcript_18021/m.57171 type:complete len:527 (-) Transcript_18021:145-1725(-)
MQLSPGAVGCALSHFRVWEAVASAHRKGLALQCALVLEDDLMAAVPDLRERLQEVLEQLPSDWDLCFVGYHTEPALQLQGLQELAEGTYDAKEPLRVEAATGGVCGLFAYLLSPKGAGRLLEDGTVFPLLGQKQIDAALSDAFDRLSVWRTPQRRPLLYSPQSQSVTSESDVQSRYYGPLEKQWTVYRRVVQECMRALDASAEGALSTVPVLPTPNDEIAAAGTLGQRRCVCVSFVDPGVTHRHVALVHLRTTLLSLQACKAMESTELPVLVVWYGCDPQAAVQAWGAWPRCSLVVRGPYAGEANLLAPGVAPWLEAHGPACQAFVSLQAFSLIELDQLLYLAPGTELTGSPGSVNAIFEEHSEAEVYVEPACEIAGTAAVRQALGLRPFRYSRAFGLHAMLYNRRAWLKVSRWAGEMLQLWLRLHADLHLPTEASASEREAVAAHCALVMSEVDLGEFGISSHLQAPMISSARADRLGGSGTGKADCFCGVVGPATLVEGRAVHDIDVRGSGVLASHVVDWVSVD